MNILCVIPARIGSQRIKRKNIMPFQGRPLITWTLDAAQSCAPLFKRIMLSSDSEDILRYGRNREGITCYERPPRLGAGTTSMRDVALDCLEVSDSVFRDKCEAVCILPPTAPLRTAADIEKCIRQWRRLKPPVVMAVSSYNLPPWQALRRTENGKVRPYWGDDVLTRKGQQIPPLFCDAGSVYVVSRDHLLSGPSLYHDDMVVVEIPQWRAADIDTMSDWITASVLAAGQAPERCPWIIKAD